MRLIVALAALALSASASATLIATIPHGSTSQIIRVPLYDQDTPEICPSTDLTSASSGLSISISSDKSNGPIDTNTSAGSTIEDIATIGTYATPTAGETRFEVTTAGSCWYELQFEDSVFSTANADRLYIEITDGGAEIMDAAFWVDLTPVAAADFIDDLMTEPSTGWTTAGTFGKTVFVDIPAILVDTAEIGAAGAGLTNINLPNQTMDITGDITGNLSGSVGSVTGAVGSVTGAVGSVTGNVGGNVVGSVGSVSVDPQNLFEGAVSSVTSQTILVTATGPAANDTHVGRSLCIKDAGDSATRDCALITDYVASTRTWTLANALNFTVATSDVVYVPANDANVRAMNNAEVCGNGQTGTPWTGNGC